MDNFNSGLYISGDGLFDFAAASAKLLRPDGECSGRDEGTESANRKKREQRTDYSRYSAALHSKDLKRRGEFFSPRRCILYE